MFCELGFNQRERLFLLYIFLPIRRIPTVFRVIRAIEDFRCFSGCQPTASIHGNRLDLEEILTTNLQIFYFIAFFILQSKL